MPIFLVSTTTKEEFEANGRTRFNEISPKFLSKLDFIVKGKKFSAGNNLTIVDFTLHEILDFTRHFDNNTLAPFPNLIAVFNNFREIPQIKVSFVY